MENILDDIIEISDEIAYFEKIYNNLMTERYRYICVYSNDYINLTGVLKIQFDKFMDNLKSLTINKYNCNFYEHINMLHIYYKRLKSTLEDKLNKNDLNLKNIHKYENLLDNLTLFYQTNIDDIYKIICKIYKIENEIHILNDFFSDIIQSDIVKNDNILYNKLYNIFREMPVINMNKYKNICLFVDYYKQNLRKILKLYNKKSECITYYELRKSKTIRFCKKIKDEYMKIAYSPSIAFKTVFDQSEIGFFIR